MSTNEDTIGVARDHRWMRLAEQQTRLQACSRVVIVIGDAKGRDFGKRAPHSLESLVMLTRPGTVIQFMYAFLLADPTKKRLRGGLRSEFERALKLIEKRGGIVRDVLTGLSTATKEKRAALLLSVADQIKRSGQGRNSEENGKLSRGRPRQWFDPERRKIVWEEWHSNAHVTNTAASEEASRRLGTRITHYTMWRIVKEMREAKGLKGRGASGRRPNSAAATLAAAVGKPDPNRPLPKARVRRGVVYFIRNGVQGRVKIGFSESHKVRMSSLQGATPDALTLIGTVPGNARLERTMHRKFDAQRIHPRREWFRIEGALAKFLKATFPKNMRT